MADWDGTLEEWRCPTFPRNRAWHLVARASDDLPPTAGVFVDHLTGAGDFTLG